jgi:DNA modification methylase
LFVGWKPVVAYIKPPAGAPWWEWFGDSVVGDGREKDDHPWQQGVTEAEHFIGHLCPEGGVVCDPFAGSGTSLVAALHLGRQIVGFEIHEGHVTTARSRLIVATR